MNLNIVRIKNVKIVSDDFRSRNASSRTYVYRLAFYNHDRLLNLNMNQAKPEKVKPAHKNLYYSFAYYQNVIENDFLIEIRFIIFFFNATFFTLINDF